MLPISNRPVLSSGYSSTNLQAAMRAGARLRWGPSNSKFDSSQCSYRLGIRAAASRVSPRSFVRHSQRVTRWSEPADFHPLPPHIGQTSAAVFINFFSFQCALPNAFAQVITAEALCTSCGVVELAVENREKFGVRWIAPLVIPLRSLRCLFELCGQRF